MPNRNWSSATIRVLLKILKDKVITEQDLVKEIDGDFGRLNMAYQSLVNAGFPIMRKQLYSHSNSGTTRPMTKNRMVVYYLT